MSDAGESPFRPATGLFIIAGPCVLEAAELNLRIAAHLAELSERHRVPVIFKGSFDKANRTSRSSHRGPGLALGLELLAGVRADTGLPLLTDVHLPEQVPAASQVVDVLQVPAFLSRQTDLLEAAGASGLPVNIKKGQWMAPGQVVHAVDKVRAAGAPDVAVTERGTAFGYGRWVVDMRSFELMRGVASCPTIFDGTHSVQLPGGDGTASGGEPQFIEPLCQAAVAAGADGVFVEVHPDPAAAPSDPASMLPLERLEPLVKRLLRLHVALSREPSSTAR